MEKKKERPGELRQQINRMRASRDNLKNTNREKAAANKKLRDRNVELTENRNLWRARSLDLDRQLRAAQEEMENQKMRAEQELERANRLQTEIEAVLGKKSGT